MASLSSSALNSHTVEDDAPELYRSFCDGAYRAFGHQSELVRNVVNGASGVLPRTGALWLRFCDQFNTVNGHLDKLKTHLRLDDEQAIQAKQQLVRFVENGLFLSRSQFMQKMAVGSFSDPCNQHIEISSVCIPTCNRTDSLQTCLTSFAQAARQFDRKLRFIVADDSSEASRCEENLSAMRSVKEQFAFDFVYVGTAEKKAFAQALAKHTGLPPALIDFAVLNPENCPIGTGANRNVLLLMTIGEAILQADDDTVCRAKLLDDASDELALSSIFDPQQSWFEESKISNKDFPLVDLFSLHETYLGKSVAAQISQAGKAVNLDQCSASFVKGLEASGGRILASAMGCAGDSGMGSSTQFLLYDDGDRARLMQSEQHYRQASQSHRQLRSVLNPTICDGSFCMALNLALDNRADLPPFMPVQRNQDGIFGCLLRATIADAYFAFSPWTVAHFKPGGRSGHTDTARFRFSDICYLLLYSEASKLPYRTDTVLALQDLGRTMINIGSMSRKSFEERVLHALLSAHINRIAELDKLMRKYRGQPHYWSKDVFSHVHSLQQSMTSPSYPVSADLEEAFGAEKARDLAPRLIRQFGELLYHWSAIRNGAKSMAGDLHGRRI